MFSSLVLSFFYYHLKVPHQLPHPYSSTCFFGGLFKSSCGRKEERSQEEEQEEVPQWGEQQDSQKEQDRIGALDQEFQKQKI